MTVVGYFSPLWFFLPPVIFYRPCPALPGLASPHQPCPALAGPVQRFMGCPGLTAPHGLGISLCVIVPFAAHQCSGCLYKFHGFPCFHSFVGFHGFRMLARVYVGLSKGIEQRFPTLVTLVALHALRAFVLALCRLPTYQAVYRRRCTGVVIFSCTHIHSAAPAVSAGLRTSLNAFRAPCQHSWPFSTCSRFTTSPHTFPGSHRYARPFAPFGWHCAALSGDTVHSQAFSAILQHLRALAAM